MVFDVTLLKTQHYKVKIKCKVEQFREWSGILPYISVQQLLKMEPSGHPPLRSPTLLTLWWDHHSINPFEFLNHKHSKQTIFLKNVPHSSIGKTLCFSMITQGYIQQKSCKTKYRIQTSVLSHSSYSPDFAHQEISIFFILNKML